MKGKVLTTRGQDQRVQVVEVTTDDDRVQIAIVAWRKGAALPSVAWSGEPKITLVDLEREVVQAAREALRMEESAVLHVFIAYLRQAVLHRPGVSESGGTPRIRESQGGRRLSFTFTHKPVDGPLDTYKVSITRQRRDRD